LADGAVSNRKSSVDNTTGQQNRDELLILSNREVTAALIHHGFNALIVS
jgi:hypothetical protein